MFKKILLLSISVVIIFIFLFFPEHPIQEKNKISPSINSMKEITPATPKTANLPKKYLIKAAFIQQAPEKKWDEPWQDACEEASLLTVDFFYKNIYSITIEENRDAILKMIDFEKTQNFTSDMTISQMSTVAQKYLNYQTEIIDNPTIDDFKKHLIKNSPIIVPASGKILFKENKHFNSGGPYYHNLVVLGYDDNKQKFIVHDVGTKAGSYFKYSYSLLIESIHDFPDSGKKEDINNGQKKVLVLLK